MSKKCKALWRLLADSTNSRIVNAFAFLALVIIASVRLFDLRMLFPGAAELGSALDGLALAYATAWFFNLIVIETPRQRNQAQNFQIAAATLRSLSGVARGIAKDVLTAANSAPEEVEECDVGSVVEAFAQLAPYNPSPVGNPHFQDGALTIKYLTWIEYFVDQSHRLSFYQSRLDPRLFLLDAKLVDLYVKVTDDPFWMLIRRIQRTPVKNSDIGFMGGTFGELMRISLALQAEVERCEAHFNSGR